MTTDLDAAGLEAQHKWNARYTENPSAPRVAPVLADYQYLLPRTGRALDLACGVGGNALCLAAHELETWAWDISNVAVARLQTLAQQQGLVLHAEVRDVVATPPAPESFDVIVVSRFLERGLAPALMQALRPAGLLFYQTFTAVSVDEAYGPTNPAYRLAPQELLTLLHGLQVVVYREEGCIGDTTQGLRNEAYIIAQKA
jgi:SAM-dependent methyltransferase